MERRKDVSKYFSMKDWEIGMTIYWDGRTHERSRTEGARYRDLDKLHWVCQIMVSQVGSWIHKAKQTNLDSRACR